MISGGALPPRTPPFFFSNGFPGIYRGALRLSAVIRRRHSRVFVGCSAETFWCFPDLFWTNSAPDSSRGGFGVRITPQIVPNNIPNRPEQHHRITRTLFLIRGPYQLGLRDRPTRRPPGARLRSGVRGEGVHESLLGVGRLSSQPRGCLHPGAGRKRRLSAP